MQDINNPYLKENEANDRKELSCMFTDGTLRWFLVDLCSLKLNSSEEEKGILDNLSIRLYPRRVFPIYTISVKA
jgi:hypothetical protein